MCAKLEQEGFKNKRKNSNNNNNRTMKVLNITLTVSNRSGQRKHTLLDDLEIAVSSSLLVVSSFIFTAISVCKEQDKKKGNFTSY